MDSQKISTGSSESDCTTVPALSVGASVARSFRKTKFYPVNLTKREIINEPHDRERDLAWKYRGEPVTGIRGDRLAQFRCYAAYALVQP